METAGDKRAGLLKQMRDKMSLNGETDEVMKQNSDITEEYSSLPLGIPPVSLDGILLSEAWYPHFLTFLRENYQLAKDQDQLKLLRECEKLFSGEEPVNKDNRRKMVRSIRKNCKEGLDGVIREFQKYVEDRKEKEYYNNNPK